MNGQKLSSLAGAALLFAGTSLQPALAQEENSPVIRVTGQGEVRLAPDMAIVSMGVTQEAATAREALDANTAAMNDVLAAMKAAGIDDRDLQTSNFSIQPQYVYPKNGENNPQPRISGYIVRNSLTVRIRDLSQTGEVLDASVSLGINEGGNLVFTNDDPKAAISEARANAMRDAIEKAGTLAKAADVRIGEIMEINEQTRQSGPVPMARVQAQVMAEAAPVPVAAGENTYRVSVNVTFGIEQ